MAWLRWSFGVAAVVGGMVVASVAADPLGWDEALAWAEAREQRWQRAGEECPVLTGVAVPGSSFEGYAAAVAALQQLDAVDAERLAQWTDRLGDAAGAGPEAREVLTALAPVVGAMRAAAHARGGPGSRSVPELGPGAPARLIDLPGAVDALRLAAREHAREGRAGEALRCLTDGVAAGIDVVHSLSVIEQVLGAIALERALRDFDDALLAAADDAALHELAAALAAADAALPVVSTLPGDAAATFALALARHDGWSARDLGLATVATWRHGFSARRFAKDRAVRAIEAMLRFEAAGGADEPWHERRPRLEAAIGDLVADQRPLHTGLVEHAVEHEAQLREAAARLRLLRLAVDWHRGAEPVALPDPFGTGPLRAAPTPDGVVFASVRAGLQRAAFAHR